MQSKLNPYLSFKDNARQAMEFYKTVFGGKLAMSTFKEYNASQDPSEDNKIMHAMLEADNGITFMASDTPDHMEYKAGTNYSMSLSGDNEAELNGYFQKLSTGGNVTMPLGKAPWGNTAQIRREVKTMRVPFPQGFGEGARRWQRLRTIGKALPSESKSGVPHSAGGVTRARRVLQKEM